MKRHFVIDVDFESSFVRVLEVTQEFTGEGVKYHRTPDADSLVNSFRPDPKFYGQLDALLITKDRVNEAEPITPEPICTPETQSAI